MPGLFVKIICFGIIGTIGLTGCAPNEAPKEKQEMIQSSNMTKSEGIVINEIENLASAKIMAESKVIEKDNLPDDLKSLTELPLPDGIQLLMMSEIYTKSDMKKEEFDVLHDYHFLYSDDAEKNIIIHASKVEVPLRDYFFQADNAVSEIYGTDVIISRYENKFIARFSHQDIHFDVETNGLTQNELVELIQNIIAR